MPWPGGCLWVERPEQVCDVACVEAGPRRAHAVGLRKGYPRWLEADPEGGAGHARAGLREKRREPRKGTR
jgi:hypothetical protein